ncbi:MAG: hypothetical protein GF344_14225 [Chitinivibrionales bacterium]|nr:hypothetical protein [Chitinivibrionales bacterium]MBD3357885.1 hypothetical protein [Chitinivibrionales bacterium]
MAVTSTPFTPSTEPLSGSITTTASARTHFIPIFGHSGRITLDTGGVFIYVNMIGSSRPTGRAVAVVVGSSGHRWVGIWGDGLLRLCDTTWTVFDTATSDVPGMYVLPLTTDSRGRVWQSCRKKEAVTYRRSYVTGGDTQTYTGETIEPIGLTVFDGDSFRTYTTANSGLPDNGVTAAAFDAGGNLWVGTVSGLAVFNEDEIVPDGQLGLKQSGPPGHTTGFGVPRVYRAGKAVQCELTCGAPSDVIVEFFSVAGRRLGSYEFANLPHGRSTISLPVHELAIAPGQVVWRVRARAGRGKRETEAVGMLVLF